MAGPGVTASLVRKDGGDREDREDRENREDHEDREDHGDREDREDHEDRENHNIILSSKWLLVSGVLLLVAALLVNGLVVGGVAGHLNRRIDNIATPVQTKTECETFYIKSAKHSLKTSSDRTLGRWYLNSSVCGPSSPLLSYSQPYFLVQKRGLYDLTLQVTTHNTAPFNIIGIERNGISMTKHMQPSIEPGEISSQTLTARTTVRLSKEDTLIAHLGYASRGFRTAQDFTFFQILFKSQ